MTPVDAVSEAGSSPWRLAVSGATADHRHSEAGHPGNPGLKARMNPNLHMAADLKATGAGSLFVVFGEPDIAIEAAGGGQIRVRNKVRRVQTADRRGRL